MSQHVCVFVFYCWVHVLNMWAFVLIFGITCLNICVFVICGFIFGTCVCEFMSKPISRTDVHCLWLLNHLMNMCVSIAFFIIGVIVRTWLCLLSLNRCYGHVVVVLDLWPHVCWVPSLKIDNSDELLRCNLIRLPQCHYKIFERYHVMVAKPIMSETQ